MPFSTSKYSPYQARNSSLGRQNPLGLQRTQSALNRANDTNWNSSVARESHGGEGEKITIDSDFVLRQAVKQARRQAAADGEPRPTLRLLVTRVDLALETFVCLECQNQCQRDNASALEIRAACEGQFAVSEKEYNASAHFVGEMHRAKASELEHVLDKLSYYMQNNVRVCEPCFNEFLRARQYQEPLIQTYRRQNPGSFVSKQRPQPANYSGFLSSSSFKTEQKSYGPVGAGSFAQTPSKLGAAAGAYSKRKRF